MDPSCYFHRVIHFPHSKTKVMPKTKSIALYLLAILSLVSGCNQRPLADLENTKSFQSGGVSFQYPGNWKLQEEPISREFRSIHIETPQNGLMIIQTYPLDHADTLQEYVKKFSESSKAILPFGEISTSTLTPEDTWEGYNWVSEKFDITLLGETKPHYRLYRTKDANGIRLFLILQSTFHDAPMLIAGVDLISKSLEFTGEAGVPPQE